MGPVLVLALADAQFGLIEVKFQGVMSQKSLKNGDFARVRPFLAVGTK